MSVSAQLDRIQDKLVAAKRDRNKFLDSVIVCQWFQEFQEAVEAVEDPEKDSQARELLHMFSLALIAVGFSRTLPANYAICITLEKLLAHLELRPMYTIHEFKLVNRRLQDIKEEIEEAHEQPIQVSAKIRHMVSVKLEVCFSSLSKIEEVLLTIPEDDVHLYSQVINLRRDIFNKVTEPAFKAEDLTEYREKLDHVSQHIGGRDTSWVIIHHLESAKFLYTYYHDGPREMDRLEPEYEELVKICHDLSVFVVTQRWTLRETDLYQYQVALSRLDQRIAQELKLNPLFVYPRRDASSQEIQKCFQVMGPFILQFFLLRKGLSLVFKLLDAAEPVAESLGPIYNQLRTAKRCLVDVKRLGGLSNLQELYPYQMKLFSLEKTRVDGKFIVDGETPPGQGILNNLLAECYDLIYELEMDLEERPQTDEINDSD